MAKHSAFPEMPEHLERLVNKFVGEVCQHTAGVGKDGTEFPGQALPQYIKDRARSRFGEEYQAGLEEGYGYKHFPYHTASAVPDCASKCETCCRQFRALELQKWPGLEYGRTYSDGQALEIVEQMVQATERDLAHVRGKIQLHGNAVAKRWRKRTPDSRAALLVASKPDIHKHR